MMTINDTRTLYFIQYYTMRRISNWIPETTFVDYWNEHGLVMPTTMIAAELEDYCYCNGIVSYDNIINWYTVALKLELYESEA